MSHVYTGTAAAGSTIQSSGFANSTTSDTSVGGLFTFDATSVSSRVGISWISKDKACQNPNDEIPEDTNFSKLVEDAKNVGNSKV